MSVLRALAPAKVNLGLFVGPRRQSDGRHELLSVMQSISLADELTMTLAPAGGGADEVRCPGVPGDPAANLAARALSAFRERTGWDAPAQLLEIRKRIPVAAGLGGGSADAAAALRLASAASGLTDTALLMDLAGALGADVPAQLSPGRWLASGAGERLQELAPPRGSLGVLVLALPTGLSTASVYAEADRLGLTRPHAELQRLRSELLDALGDGAALADARELLGNDLQAAALSLCPEIAPALAQARDAGAAVALVSGSGPTVLGLFADSPAGGEDGVALARRAALAMAGRVPGAVAAEPVGHAFGAVGALGEGPALPAGPA
jgi:4-diphosphocytidyl-2-C-methyl-D-erythritol kinase